MSDWLKEKCNEDYKGVKIMGIKGKIGAALATGGLMMSSLAGSALANTNVTISGNGAFSDNNVHVSQSQRTTVNQHNEVDIRNDVSVKNNTGNNQANFNTGGNVYVRSGDINTKVRIHNNANVNRIYVHDGKNFYHKDFSRTVNANMTGSQEVPGPGDSNAYGTAVVTLSPKDGKLCSTLQVHNIAPATAAHIHQGAWGVAGSAVVNLPTPNANGYADGCMSVSGDMLKNIENNPSNYYVNVHNNDYPDGALRGQLK